LAKRDDAFISSDQGKGLSDGDTHHRNSWLMPKMARRLTRNSPHHVSNWRPDVTVNLDDCRRIRSLLVEKMGSIHDAEQYLPRACKKM
jgi:predicted transposase YbfD/YdcC